MSFSAGDSPLRHILESIETIRAFLGDLTFQQYQADLKTKSAVERQLQILTEAAFRLGDDADQVCPGVDWRGIRGMGNFLRHHYERVEDVVIWDAVHLDLPKLESAVRNALATMEGEWRRDHP